MFKLILNAPIPAGCSQALEDQGQVPLEAPEDNNICQIAIFLKARRCTPLFIVPLGAKITPRRIPGKRLQFHLMSSGLSP